MQDQSSMNFQMADSEAASKIVGVGKFNIDHFPKVSSDTPNAQCQSDQQDVKHEEYSIVESISEHVIQELQQ